MLRLLAAQQGYPISLPEPTEEELKDQEKAIKEAEEELAEEKSRQLASPTSLDFELLDGILSEVQNEIQSKQEDHEETLRALFTMWLPMMKKIRRLNMLIDSSRTVLAYEGFLDDRRQYFIEVKATKKKYISRMTKLKDDALESEDFRIVHIASRELKDAHERVEDRMYRTRREHVLYHSWRYFKLTLQFLIALVLTAAAYGPFLILFLVSFVCSRDVDITNSDWHGEDLEASIAAAFFPVMVVAGLPGYWIDVRNWLFGREGERRHWIWRKVFRPRDFDAMIMKQLFDISDKINEEEEARALERDMKKTVEELEEEARGGVKEFAAGVLDNKETRNKKSKGVLLGDQKMKSR